MNNNNQKEKINQKKLGSCLIHVCVEIFQQQLVNSNSKKKIISKELFKVILKR